MSSRKSQPIYASQIYREIRKTVMENSTKGKTITQRKVAKIHISKNKTLGHACAKDIVNGYEKYIKF